MSYLVRIGVSLEPLKAKFIRLRRESSKTWISFMCFFKQTFYHEKPSLKLPKTNSEFAPENGWLEY